MRENTYCVDCRDFKYIIRHEPKIRISIELENIGGRWHEKDVKKEDPILLLRKLEKTKKGLEDFIGNKIIQEPSAFVFMAMLERGNIEYGIFNDAEETAYIISYTKPSPLSVCKEFRRLEKTSESYTSQRRNRVTMKVETISMRDCLGKWKKFRELLEACIYDLKRLNEQGIQETKGGITDRDKNVILLQAKQQRVRVKPFNTEQGRGLKLDNYTFYNARAAQQFLDALLSEKRIIEKASYDPVLDRTNR